MLPSWWGSGVRSLPARSIPSLSPPRLRVCSVGAVPPHATRGSTGSVGAGGRGAGAVLSEITAQIARWTLLDARLHLTFNVSAYLLFI